MSFDEFRTGGLVGGSGLPAPTGGTWHGSGDARDLVVPGRWGMDEALRRSGYVVRFDTPHHRGDAGLRVYERYVGLRGQERVGLVDEQGRVWHYDSAEVSFEARLEPPYFPTPPGPGVNIAMRRRGFKWA